MRLLLDYGSRSKVSRRKVLRLGMAAVAALIAIASVLSACYRIYDTRLTNAAERVLRAATNVRSVELNGYHRNILSPCMALSAAVNVNADGSKVIQFQWPDGRELSNGSHIRLSMVGSIALSYGSPGMPPAYYVDVGREGEFGGMLPFQVRNVSDVTSHYDELLAFVKSLPSVGAYRGNDGVVRQFEVH